MKLSKRYKVPKKYLELAKRIAKEQNISLDKALVLMGFGPFDKTEAQYQDPPTPSYYRFWVPEHQEIQEDERIENKKLIDKEQKQKYKKLKLPGEEYKTRQEIDLEKIKGVGFMKGKISKRAQSFMPMDRPIDPYAIKSILEELKKQYPRTYRTRITPQIVHVILDKLKGVWYGSQEALKHDVDRVYDEYARFLETSRVDKGLIKLANELDEMSLYKLANLVDEAKLIYNQGTFDRTLKILKEVGDRLDEAGLLNSANQVTRLISGVARVELISVLEKIIKAVQQLKDLGEMKKFIVDFIKGTTIKDEDKRRIVHNTEQVKSKGELIQYLFNSLLKYEGFGVIR